MFTFKVGQPDDLLISPERNMEGPTQTKEKREPEFKYRALKSLLLMHSLNLLKHRAENIKIQFLC